MKLDPHLVTTPAYVLDLEALRSNVAVLESVQQRSGCRIVLALKGFALWGAFEHIRGKLVGTAASSPHEAELGAREFGGEVHAYAPAYSDEDVQSLVKHAHHMVFNSERQWHRHRTAVQGASREIRAGYRINPEHSEMKRRESDPCARGSRLGMTLAALESADFSGISGLHFHSLCQGGPDALGRTLAVIETKFAPYLDRIQWMNFGGGHHITRPGYDVDLLVRLIKDFRERWGVEVYLEPGEAVALNAGVLVTSVLDVIRNDIDIAIVDTSASAHMPDVLEMPYRPLIRGAAAPGEKPYTFRIGGMTCLAGDVIGDYSFDRPLEVGDRLVLEDMAHYTMVKNTTFNGVRLPDIVTFEPTTGQLRVLRHFAYEDYRDRLS